MTWEHGGEAVHGEITMIDVSRSTERGRAARTGIPARNKPPTHHHYVISLPTTGEMMPAQRPHRRVTSNEDNHLRQVMD
jgi:hypothetical protein